MPYNTNPIPKRKLEECDGTPILPLARVRKIIKLDEDIDACTPAAAFLITIASEMFIQELAESAHRMTKIEKKQRKNIQYKDLANAVARMDKLEFLSDIIPKTIPFSKVLERKRVGPAFKDNGVFDATGPFVTKGPKEATRDTININGTPDTVSSGSSPVANETSRMKDLHLSNQSASAGTKKTKALLKDQDGDSLMH